MRRRRIITKDYSANLTDLPYYWTNDLALCLTATFSDVIDVRSLTRASDSPLVRCE